MKLPTEAIKEYQQVYFAEFGEQISEEEAELQAKKVLSFLTYIFNNKPNEHESLSKRSSRDS